MVQHSFHWLSKVDPKGIQDNQASSSQQTARLKTLQTFWIQSFMPSASIQPLGWWWTTTPGRNFSLHLVFQLKMIIGFNFAPSARQERTTLKRDFSWPVVVMETVFFLFMCWLFWSMAFRTRQESRPYSQCSHVHGWLSFCSSAWNNGSLQSSPPGLPTASEQSSSSDKELNCYDMKLVYTSCWKPGSQWCSVHQSFQVPWFRSWSESHCIQMDPNLHCLVSVVHLAFFTIFGRFWGLLQLSTCIDEVKTG